MSKVKNMAKSQRANARRRNRMTVLLYVDVGRMWVDIDKDWDHQGHVGSNWRPVGRLWAEQEMQTLLNQGWTRDHWVSSTY